MLQLKLTDPDRYFESLDQKTLSTSLFENEDSSQCFLLVQLEKKV